MRFLVQDGVVGVERAAGVDGVVVKSKCLKFNLTYRHTVLHQGLAGNFFIFYLLCVICMWYDAGIKD